MRSLVATAANVRRLPSLLALRRSSLHSAASSRKFPIDERRFFSLSLLSSPSCSSPILVLPSRSLSDGVIFTFFVLFEACLIGGVLETSPLQPVGQKFGGEGEDGIFNIVTERLATRLSLV